jgi:hypothetical protein
MLGALQVSPLPWLSIMADTDENLDDQGIYYCFVAEDIGRCLCGAIAVMHAHGILTVQRLLNEDLTQAIDHEVIKLKTNTFGIYADAQGISGQIFGA